MMDRISTLPDAVLCHILSFLETKQAVATSILSNRWKHLWLSVPVLDFGLTRLTDKDANFLFNDFVSSVLLSRDAAAPIKSFRLYVIYNYSGRVNLCIPSFAKWINFVLQRGVEYLHLHVSTVSLPISILNCTTLVVLKLSGFSVEEGFSSVLLPSLRTLQLKHISLPKLEDFMIFLRGCPNLEDLHTCFLSYDSEESDGESLTDEWKSFFLSNLTTADIDSFPAYFPLNVVHNVSSLRFEVKEVYYYLDDLIPTFHNLTQLELICMDYYTCEFIVEVLKHCPKLQKLDIDQGDIDGNEDRKENWVDPNVVPQCLSLHLRTCNLFNFLGLQSELLLARYILKNASVLQSMKIWNRGQPKIRRKLSSFPRASSTCKLTVYHAS